jgi:site-specific DNA-methyltransferase (adenine-specific)
MIEQFENKIINADCLDILKQLPDKCIDLVLTDPPYGKQYARGKNGWGVCENRPDLKDVAWDNTTPSKELFDEIIRVSKNQIIFGGNYFTDKLSVSNCWIVWDKIGNNINKSVFADLELAWTSFNSVCRKFVSVSMGFIKDDKSERIHPTQKPVDLFEKILSSYSKENDLILDCFSGSGTTAVACHNIKRKFICIEKDKDYYEASVKRLEEHQKQLTLF